MTNEEALKIALSTNPLLRGGGDSSEYVECIIEALEKQIPKKPVADNYEGHIGKKCICGEQVWRHQKHCENCGQLQDWSDDND